MPKDLPPLDPPRKQLRGFAAMDPEKRREISRKGGAAVPAEMRSYSQNRTLASSAGSKGGKVTNAARRANWEALKKRYAKLPRDEMVRLHRLARQGRLPPEDES